MINKNPESRDLGQQFPGIREVKFPGISRDSGFGKSRDASLTAHRALEGQAVTSRMVSEAQLLSPSSTAESLLFW